MNELLVELVTTGIAIISNPFDFNILVDSLKKYWSGLKCCADSKATTLSAHLSAKGNVVAVAFTKDIMSRHITGAVTDCLTFASAVLIILLPMSALMI